MYLSSLSLHFDSDILWRRITCPECELGVGDIVAGRTLDSCHCMAQQSDGVRGIGMEDVVGYELSFQGLCIVSGSTLKRFLGRF